MQKIGPIVLSEDDCPKGFTDGGFDSTMADALRDLSAGVVLQRAQAFFRI